MLNLKYFSHYSGSFSIPIIVHTDLLYDCFLPWSMQSPSPAPVQKLPIPQEHMPMVQAFDAMLERCKGRANTTVSYDYGN